MKTTYYSNGKLLLTGEYVVLDGASALAIPTRFGQKMDVTPSKAKGIRWSSVNSESKLWFEGEFSIGDDEIQTASEYPVATILQKLLNSAKQINPQFLLGEQGFDITTTLEFPNNWGLGSSSTLINNLAQWADVDPFKLLDKGFGGSGYDIAAAGANGPIRYKRVNDNPQYEQLKLLWEFTNQLFFVHLNEKQDSKLGIERYRSLKGSQQATINTISEITELVIQAEELESFVELMEAHEEIIAELIDLPTAKEALFKDYHSLVKSLGAWGGDFVLVVGEESDKDYFRNKGYRTILDFSEMIK